MMENMPDWINDFLLITGAAIAVAVVIFGIYLWVTNGFEYWEE